MRSLFAAMAALAAPALLLTAPAVPAQPPPPPAAVECDYPNCTPGIAPNIVLGSYCSNNTYYVFGVTSWGRLVFCGSARRYEQRWFRSPVMHGVKDEGADCAAFDGDVAQSPEGLFLTCISKNNHTYWTRGDISVGGVPPIAEEDLVG